MRRLGAVISGHRLVVDGDVFAATMPHGRVARVIGEVNKKRESETTSPEKIDTVEREAEGVKVEGGKKERKRKGKC